MRCFKFQLLRAYAFIALPVANVDRDPCQDQLDPKLPLALLLRTDEGMHWNSSTRDLTIACMSLSDLQGCDTDVRLVRTKTICFNIGITQSFECRDALFHERLCLAAGRLSLRRR